MSDSYFLIDMFLIQYSYILASSSIFTFSLLNSPTNSLILLSNYYLYLILFFLFSLMKFLHFSISTILDNSFTFSIKSFFSLIITLILFLQYSISYLSSLISFYFDPNIYLMFDREKLSSQNQFLILLITSIPSFTFTNSSITFYNFLILSSQLFFTSLFSSISPSLIRKYLLSILFSTIILLIAISISFYFTFLYSNSTISY